MRCDQCGAHNTEEATWCTQCYASYTADTPEGTSAVTDAGDTLLGASPQARADTSSGTPPDASQPSTESEGRQPSTASVVEVGDVRDHDGVIEWRCRACESWVALEMPSCHACGSPRAGFGEQVQQAAPVAVADQRRVLGAAAIFPGVGHVLAGRTGSGVTRLVLGLLWLIGGIWWVATTEASDSAPGVVLLVGTLVLWVASYLDVQAILSSRDEPFGVRGLLWTVVGVTALLMIAVAWLATGPTLG